MLQCVCSVVDHSWRQSVVLTKKWRSEPCGLGVTISASCDWSVAIFTRNLTLHSGILPYKSLEIFSASTVLSHGSIILYNAAASPASRLRSAGSLAITPDFFRLHNTLARLYNAAASPASRLRSAGSLAIMSYYVNINCGPQNNIVTIMWACLKHEMAKWRNGEMAK